MSERFDDLAISLASENPVGRRSMVRSVLAAMGLWAGAVVARQKPAAAAPPTKPTTCPAGLTACGTVCRDLTSSNGNRGTCGTSCAADSVCRNGTCVRVSCICNLTCPTGLTWCGACVNTANDAANCGTCGNNVPAWPNLHDGEMPAATPVRIPLRLPPDGQRVQATDLHQRRLRRRLRTVQQALLRPLRLLRRERQLRSELSCPLGTTCGANNICVPV